MAITFKAKIVVEDYLYIKKMTGEDAPHLEILSRVHTPLPFGSRGTIFEGSLLEPEEEINLVEIAKSDRIQAETGGLHT